MNYDLADPTTAQWTMIAIAGIACLFIAFLVGGFG
jgi:hypothetical protein